MGENSKILGGFIEKHNDARGSGEVGCNEYWKLWFSQARVEWKIECLKTEGGEACVDFLTNDFWSNVLINLRMNRRAVRCHRSWPRVVRCCIDHF